jgi:hypothetical protein
MKQIHMILIGVGVLFAAAFALTRPASESVRLPETQKDPNPVRTRAADRDVLSQSAPSSLVDPSAIHDSVETRQSVSQTPSTSNLTIKQSGTSPQTVQRNRRVSPRAMQTASQVLSDPFSDESRPRVDSIRYEISPREESVSQPALLPAQSPAALIEIDDPRVSHPEARERLTGVALDFTAALTQSGLDPANPGYREIWDRERIVAETRFRSMYGGQAWMNHHIQSHHAQAEPTAP